MKGEKSISNEIGTKDLVLIPKLLAIVNPDKAIRSDEAKLPIGKISVTGYPPDNKIINAEVKTLPSCIHARPVNDLPISSM
ncbi:hypothetical protein EEGS03_12730 [Escherichia coli]|nr:hypothetical protein EEGS03_12730 [Escherichia coli]GMM23281.1 hypothetical protein KTU0001_07030 [Escherichia coli]